MCILKSITMKKNTEKGVNMRNQIKSFSEMVKVLYDGYGMV